MQDRGCIRFLLVSREPPSAIARKIQEKLHAGGHGVQLLIVDSDAPRPDEGGVCVVVDGSGGRRSFDEISSTSRALRQRFPRSCLVVLGPDLDGNDVVAILESGADDYLRDSLRQEELLARLLIRAGSMGRARPRSDGAVGRGAPARSAALTATEQRIVDYLAQHERATPEQLARELGRKDLSGRGRDLVYRHIANIRRKLELADIRASLVSTRDGYRWRTD